MCFSVKRIIHHIANILVTNAGFIHYLNCSFYFEFKLQQLIEISVGLCFSYDTIFLLLILYAFVNLRTPLIWIFLLAHNASECHVIFNSMGFLEMHLLLIVIGF